MFEIAVWEACRSVLHVVWRHPGSHIVTSCIARAGSNASTSETKEPTEDAEESWEGIGLGRSKTGWGIEVVGQHQYVIHIYIYITSYNITS